MNNLGINVKINDKQICKAGFDKGNFVLTAIASLQNNCDDSGYFSLDISGNDAETGDSLDWNSTALNLGDVITLEVIQGEFDPPSSRKECKTIEEEMLQHEIKIYNRLKEELKGYINEK